MKVSALSQKKVCAISPEGTVLDAARRMRESHVGDVVVVEERDGKNVPVGMLTDRDIALALVNHEPNALLNAPVENVATMECITAHEDDVVTDVLEKMREHAVRRIPIVDDDGALCGIIAADDMLAYVADLLFELRGLTQSQPLFERVSTGD